MLSCVFALQLINAQTVSDNSQIISALLAPDGDIVHTNCSQHGYGGHYNEIVDEELNRTVSQFQIHKTNDVEACKNFGTRFNEFKTIADAPKKLVGAEGETVTYSWKFKFNDNFEVIKNNIDIHQLKAVGGSEADIPLISLTATRKGRFESLELRYSEEREQTILETMDITNLKGQWIEVTETITYNEIGAYAITIETVNDGEVLLEYSDDATRTWRTDADVIRPKWGIYKESPGTDTDLEKSILFTDFNIEENSNLTAFQSSLDNASISVFPNPASSKVTMKGANLDNYDAIVLHDSFGREVPLKNPIVKNSFNISNLKNGIYFVVFKKDNEVSAVKKLLKF